MSYGEKNPETGEIEWADLITSVDDIPMKLAETLREGVPHYVVELEDRSIVSKIVDLVRWIAWTLRGGRSSK